MFVKCSTLTAQKLEANRVSSRLLRDAAAALYKTGLKTSPLPKPECPLNSIGSGTPCICPKEATQGKASLFSDLTATLGKTCVKKHPHALSWNVTWNQQHRSKRGG